MFAGVAATDAGDITDDPPEKRITLNLSDGCRSLMRSFNRALDVFKGNPFMEPDMSTTNIYSLGGISFVRTQSGG